MAANRSPMINGNTSSVFRLRVNNIPSELEKDAIEAIFGEYGTVTGVQLIKQRIGDNSAYITFSKYIEAENAISGLHQKMPLMLNIQFQDKDMKNFQKSPEYNLAHPVVDHRYKDSYLDHVKSGSKLIDLGKVKCTPGFQPNNYTHDDELLYEYPTDLTTFNPYENAGPYKDTNLMYTRGIVHVTDDGKRHVAYGRGYTFYNIPEPHYNIEPFIQNVVTRREKGLYEFAPENEEEASGLCKVCSCPTAFRCQQCEITFYCSKTCQIEDWLKHKQDCQPLPSLVKKVFVNSEQNGSPKIEAVLSHDENIKSTLRRPRTQPSNFQSPMSPPRENLSNQTDSPKSPVQDSSRRWFFINKLKESSKAQNEKTTPTAPQSPARSTKSNYSGGNRNNNDNRNFKRSPPGNFKANASSFPSQHPQKSQQNQRNQNLPERLTANRIVDDDLGFHSAKDFLPKDKFAKVMVTVSLEKGEYWVQKVENGTALTKMIEKLQDFASKKPNIEIEEGIKCAFMFESMWFRATIIRIIEDRKCLVFFNDFGTTEETEVTRIVSIDNFEKPQPPPFARKIRVINSDSELYNLKDRDYMMVKAQNMTPEGIIIVQAQKVIEEKEKLTEQMTKCKLNESNSTAEPPEEELAIAKLTNMPNVLDILQVGESGIIIFHALLGENEYNITLVPQNLINDFETLLEDLKQDCLSFLVKNPNYRSQVGELVCGQSLEEEWFRGIIMQTKPVINLAVIDEARIFVPTKIAPVPDKYKNIISWGVVCKFLPNTKMPSDKLVSGAYKVVKVSENSATINISVDEPEFVGVAVVNKWQFKPEQKGIKWAQLISGQEVNITDFSSQNLIHVRSQEAQESERTHLLEQEVAKYALNRQPLTVNPVVGQMILAQFSLDENFYRAIVTKIEGEKVMIKYIDYGNTEVTTLNKLYALPEHLKGHAAAVARIKLKDIPEDVPLTQEATQYFQELVGQNVALKCTFTGHPMENGVVLVTPRNENVNNILKNLLKPSWEKKDPQKDTKVYKLEDMPPTKLGDVGDEVEAICLHFYEQGSIIFGPNDIAAAQAVQVDLTKVISKYVETTTTHYIPRDTELCIAKYADAYYRGVCLESSCAPDESRIFFIDFGNSERVKHEDIRVITDDFINIPAFAVLCNIEPIVTKEKYNEVIADRIKELASPGEIFVIKVVSIADDETPNVDVPDIRVKLIEEGLI